MDGLKNYREKLKSIEKLVDKMESGELSIHELVELESLTRDLHERSIILKYKAFEGQVDVSPVSSMTEEIVIEEVAIQPIFDEEKEVTNDEFETEEEETVLDFSLFDEPEEEEQPVQESKEETESIPVQIEVVEETAEPEIVQIPVAENRVVEEPIAVVREKGSSFLDRLSILDNSISSQLAGRKIDTLVGAFGINERMLYINELFDGSGESFSDAIKSLDSQSSLDQASHKVEELAFKNSWNPEEEVVLEFLAIIKRRYA